MSLIKVYVEGGGDRKDIKVKCRRGFAEFFRKIVPNGKQPRVIACGPRSKAYKSFCTAACQNPQNMNILLVDSEGPVNKNPWEHLKDRDGWNRPDKITDDSAHLMVVCMESWFLADQKALKEFYGRELWLKPFKPLQPRGNIEKISKLHIEWRLEEATKSSQKGRYHKTKHAFDILALIDPAKLADDRVSSHAKRLIDYLKGLTAENV